MDEVRDTLVTFDVAPDYTPWKVAMTRANAERLAETVRTTSDPDATVTFCDICLNGSSVGCPHVEHIQVLAIGNLLLQPLNA